MTQYYFIYNHTCKMFLSHSGKYEYTRKEADKIIEMYKKDETLCPNGNVSDILTLYATEDIMENIKFVEGESAE